MTVWMKKSFALLATVMCMSLFSPAVFAQACPGNVRAEPAAAGLRTAADNGMSVTADQAIAWLKEHEGTTVGGGQCGSMVYWYIDAMGVTPPSCSTAIAYASCDLPSGFVRYTKDDPNHVPQKGDILIWDGNGGVGHVGVYESDYSTWHQNVNNVQKVANLPYYYTLESWDHNLTYWGLIRPNFLPPLPPSTASLEADRAIAAAGETVHFTCSADQPSEFVLHVEDSEAEIAAINATGSIASYAFPAAGAYYVWVEAVNTLGSCRSESTVYRVYSSAPTQASVSANPSTAGVGETVSFFCHSDQASQYVLHVEDHGTEIAAIEVSGVSTSYAFPAAGTYDVWIDARNSLGSCRSEAIPFGIYTAAPGSVVLSADLTEITARDTVTFVYSSDQPCEFTLRIERQGEWYKTIHTSGGTESYTFMDPGVYFIRLKAENGLGSVWSDVITLQVHYPEYPDDPLIMDKGTCGADDDNLTWVLYEDRTLVIYGEGDMAVFTNGSRRASAISQEALSAAAAVCLL